MSKTNPLGYLCPLMSKSCTSVCMFWSAHLRGCVIASYLDSNIPEDYKDEVIYDFSDAMKEREDEGN